MCWRSAWLTVCSCAVLLSACGGNGRHAAPVPKPPRIPADVARRLAEDAARVASTPGCAARDAAIAFRRDVIAEIARVPTRYRAQLMGTANDLVGRIPPCLQPAEENNDEREHGHHGKHKGRKGHG